MSSVNLDTLITEFPEERAAVEKLAAYIDSTDVSGRARPELTVQRLYDLIKPSSQRVLAKILVRLAQEGIVKQIVRVESEARGGIGDFDSLVDVPPVIFDSRIGHDVRVSMDNVRLIYRLERHLD